MPRKPRLHRLWLLPLLLLALVACSGERPFARLSGLILNSELREISGMAASRVHEGVLWVHNDGGHAPVLYAISQRGRLLARLNVAGVTNTDWEDLATFEQDGKHYLLIADTGDNGGLRKTLQLHAVQEPTELADSEVSPAWTLTFRWPDGPRDVEAVAVDGQAGQILLISKRRRPPQLFALPLQATPGEVHEAQLLGELHGVPVPDPALEQQQPRHARLIGMVTAADISPDGQQLAVLTYQDVLFYARQPGQDWAEAVTETPVVRGLPLLPQAEALAWSAVGSGLFATGEFSPAPLYWLRPPSSQD